MVSNVACVRRLAQPHCSWRPSPRASPREEPASAVIVSPAAASSSAVKACRECYRVAVGFVNVRSERTVSSHLLARRYAGETFWADANVEGWVREAALFGASAGWLLIDGSSLGLGTLLERLDENDTEVAPGSVPSQTSDVRRHLHFLVRPPPAATHSGGALPNGTSAPVRRWRVARPLTLVHAQPDRSSPVVDVAVAKQIVWTCNAHETLPVALRTDHAGRASAADNASPPPPPPLPQQQPMEDAEGVWHRVAQPDGWIHHLCPAGHVQLNDDHELHRGDDGRELEALDLYLQVRRGPKASPLPSSHALEPCPRAMPSSHALEPCPLLTLTHPCPPHSPLGAPCNPTDVRPRSGQRERARRG